MQGLYGVTAVLRIPHIFEDVTATYSVDQCWTNSEESKWGRSVLLSRLLFAEPLIVAAVPPS